MKKTELVPLEKDHIGYQILAQNKDQAKEEAADDKDEDELMGDEPTDDYNWYFIDEEEDFETLIESLNAKGIHEKKLIENLKKIRQQLKLKKVKKANSPTKVEGKPLQSFNQNEESKQNKDDTNQINKEGEDENM